MTHEQHKKLLHSFPRIHREIIEGNTTLAFSFGLALFFVWLLGGSERLWPTMLAAILGPLLSAFTLILKPLNPYEGNIYAKLEGVSFSKMQHVAGAQTLVELLESRAAWAYITRIAAFSTLALMVLIPLVSLTFGGKPHTTARSGALNQVIVGSLMFGVSTFGVEAMLLLRWAVQKVRQTRISRTRLTVFSRKRALAFEADYRSPGTSKEIKQDRAEPMEFALTINVAS